MTAQKKLTVERRNQENETGVAQIDEAGVVLVAPLVDEDYWSYRVKLSDTQAIVGFPKYNTIGVGFAVEEDWNTNLPYSVGVDRLFKHIKHNKGDKTILDTDVRRAIKLIIAAVKEDCGEI